MQGHQNIQVRGSNQQPLQLLMDKLSTKNSDLYIFWQNYNQLYHQYNEKITEIVRLKQQNQLLRRDKNNIKVISHTNPEDGFLKERYVHMEKSCEDFRLEIDRNKLEIKDLKRENQKYHDENIHLQNLLQQLRDENQVQRSNIEKILQQLKNAQTQITTMSKVYDELGQKDILLNRYIAREKQLLDCIANLQSEIDQMTEQSRQTKAMYEKLIKESMQNAKNKVIQSLPNLLQASKHKVQIVSH